MYERFGHYKEGCTNMHVQIADKNTTKSGKQQGREEHSNQIQTIIDRLWSVVHKHKRARKVGGSMRNNIKNPIIRENGGSKNGRAPAKFNVVAESFGSRFNALDKILNDGDKMVIGINDQMIGNNSVTDDGIQSKPN
ncbi:unnamed protein product [Lathyrus oleraceus]